MNKYTGTFDIKLGGKEYTLRPTFEALVEFEDRAGIAVNEAFKDMLAGKMSFKTVACAIWAGMLGEALYNGKDRAEVPYVKIGETIRKDGLQSHVISAQHFFSMALIPEEDQKKLSEESEERVASKKNT